MIADISVNTVVAPPSYSGYSQNTTEQLRFESPTSRSRASTAGVYYVVLPPDSSTAVVRSPICDDFTQHFSKIAKLPRNPLLWPDGAEQPNQISTAWATLVLQTFKDYSLVPSRVVASADGGIAICIVHGSKYADIECLNSGEILAVNSDTKNLPMVWEVKHKSSEIALSVSRIRQFIFA